MRPCTCAIQVNICLLTLITTENGNSKNFATGPTPSLWDDINSSIQKLDPMHVDVSNGCYSPGPAHKYRGDPDYRGDPEVCGDEGIKSEPMYLGEGEGYVNDTYNQVS